MKKQKKIKIIFIVFFFSVIQKDTGRFVKFSPRNAIADVAEISSGVFGKKKRGFFSRLRRSNFFFEFPTRKPAGR